MGRELGGGKNGEGLGSSGTGEKGSSAPPLVILCPAGARRDCEDCDLKGRITPIHTPIASMGQWASSGEAKGKLTCWPPCRSLSLLPDGSVDSRWPSLSHVECLSAHVRGCGEGKISYSKTWMAHSQLSAVTSQDWSWLRNKLRKGDKEASGKALSLE